MCMSRDIHIKLRPSVGIQRSGGCMVREDAWCERMHIFEDSLASKGEKPNQEKPQTNLPPSSLSLRLPNPSLVTLSFLGVFIFFEVDLGVTAGRRRSSPHSMKPP
jgi:hypothetical protein